MDATVAVRTIVPILLLIALGFASRKIGILRKGDERVLNSYVYYFALPALFLIDLSETSLSQENLRFVAAGTAPILIALTFLVAAFFVFRFSRDTLYLLVLSTVFGSLAFFGIPFITFAFPTREAENLAALSSSSILLVGVSISITILEFRRLEKSPFRNAIRNVAKRLAKNPLILSIFFGVLLSLTGAEVPEPLSTALHMLGGTTTTVAIFMLGVFLYGRRYTNISRAAGLSLLRIVFLPTIGLLVAPFFGLSSLQRTVLVLMHSMPVAISMMILSERYDFHKETIASVILISSIGAGLYLNLWLLLLG